MPTFKKFLRHTATVVSLSCLAIPITGNSILAAEGGAAASGEVQKSQLLDVVKNAKVAGIRIAHIDDIRAFYQTNGQTPIWTNGTDLNGDAKAILQEMEDSWKHGLNPDNYHFAQLKTTLRGAEAEIIFSDSVIQFASDLSGMRLPPKAIGEDASSWSRGVEGHTLLKALAESNNPSGILEGMSPQDETYKALQSMLVELSKSLAKNPEKSGRVASYPGLIRPGMTHAAIPLIREKLALPSELPENQNVYDTNLVRAVVQFQKLNGLKPDGLIGRRSFAAINQTREQKLIKVLANLERRRWVRRAMPERYVAVNIPSMTLRAFDSNNVVFEIPVIIGKIKRQTVSFVDEIVGVRFNPSWYVPDTIKNEDYLPELQKDPEALSKKGIMFRIPNESGGMKQVASSDIDWSHVTKDNLKSIQMVQGPGAANVLGRIRVLMPNRYDIYLHDTSAPELFAKDDRALSSGCVRLSEPRRIANFILEKNADWSNDRLEKYLSDDKTREVAVKSSLPVYIFYYTAWMDEKGSLIIGDDLYGKDSKLAYYLKQAGKIPFDLKVSPPSKN